MENYGFVLLDTDEAKNLGLPDGSGLFSELFNQMEYELSQFPNKKADYKQAMFYVIRGKENILYEPLFCIQENEKRRCK